MPRVKEIKTDNPFTDVTLEDFEIDGRVQKDRHVVVTDDAMDRHHIVTVSRDYRLIKNEVLYQVGMDVMNRSPYGFKHLKRYWDGFRYIEYYISDEPVLNNVDGKTGLHIGLMWKNAYDKSSKAVEGVFALHPGCLNQYHSGNLLGLYEVRHSGGNGDNVFDDNSVEDGVKNLQEGVSNLIALAPRFEELNRTALTVPCIKTAYGRNILPDSKWPKVLGRLSSESDTQFGFFQALTHVATHDMPDWTGHNTREKVTEYFLDINYMPYHASRQTTLNQN